MATLNGHLNARRILSGDLYGGIATGTFNYNELENKPSINNTTLQGNITLNIPTATSDLTNDSGFITSSDIPAIPTLTSQLTNDSGFITSSDVPTATSELLNDSGFITSSDIPTNISAFNNDSGYVTSATAPVRSVNGLSGDVTVFVPMATSQLTNDAGFITSSDIPVTSVNTLTGDVVLTGGNVKYDSNTTLNAKIDSVEGSIPTKTSDLNNDSGFITSSDIPVTSVNTLTGSVVLDGTNVNYDANTTLNAKIDAVEGSIPTKTSDLNNDSGFIASSDVNVGYDDISNAGDSVLIQDGANDTPVVYMNIEISPIQASGTPTPSNPLPITGLTDVVITVEDSESNQTINTISLGTTVYGGTLNVTTGELTITHGFVDLGSLNWSYITSGNFPRFQAPLTITGKGCDDNTQIADIICEIYGVSSWANVTNNAIYDEYLAENSNGGYITIHDSNYTSVSDFINAVTGKKIIYELATPTTLTITPTDIKTFATLCTITVNSNCNIAYIRYFTEGSEIIVPQVKKILQAFNLI